MSSQDKSVQLKLSLLKLAGEIGSVSRACAMMNFSRDSYYRFKAQYQRGGEEALKSVNRKKPLLKNRVSNTIESAVRNLALDHPGYGQQRASAVLLGKNIVVSPSGVRSIWTRHDLETQSKRAQAIRSRMLQDGLVPAPEQLDAMRATAKTGRPGDLELGGPGFLCFHGVKSLGEIAGIGPVFVQIFQDIYSRQSFVRLDTDKDGLTAMEFLKHRVLPWFESQETPIQFIRSDRSMTFCGHGKQNGYQSFLKDLGIEHSFRASRREGRNEPWVSFYQTMKDEFFRFALPSRTSWTLAALQQAADDWVSFHNGTRPNMFRFCYGKTPARTFSDARAALRAAGGTASASAALRRSSG